MATSTSSVADMAHHIERIVDKPSWQTDSAIKGDLMRVLGKLTTVRVDVDLLKSTGIGKWVKKLTKYDDEVVRGYSSSLTEKWKAQVGVPNEKATSSAPRDSVSPSSARQSTGDADRLEQARKKLQEKYASEKAKREARTVQVLSKPMTKRRGTTISAAPSRSTVGAARSKLASMSIQRRTAAAPATSSASSSMARRPLSASAASGLSSMNSQRPSTAPPQSGDDARLRKRERLLALAKQARQSEGRPSASTMQRAPMGRLQSSDLPSGSTMGSSNRRAVPDKPVDARKAMLDKMFPRVCGVAETTTGSKSSRRAGGSGGAAAANGQASKSKKKPVNYSEGQREVIQWLKGLDVDMSSYASAFFDNGFDSIKLLNEIKPRDLESMVPKTGHQRMIDKALAELKRKHATSAASRPRSASRDHRDRDRDRDRGGSARRRPQSDSYFDSESDDSFVVSDGDEYAPGVITAMLRKGRKRRYSIDSTDSYNMEASYEDIQKEEKRSKLIGDYEDYREELRNKKMLKKGM